jgi:ribosomal protein L29
MAKKLSQQTREELAKELQTKQADLQNVVLAVGGLEPHKKLALRKDIARIQTAISSLDKSAQSL